jgi:hypothetical protein
MGIIISSSGTEKGRLNVGLLSSYTLNPRIVLGFSLRVDPKSGRAGTHHDPS